MLKTTEIRKFSLIELKNRLATLQQNYFDFLMQLRIKNLKNNQVVKHLRREVARYKTIIHQYSTISSTED